ncbi:MAG TPA: MFS transporter, partial [Gemmatimonadales bacterium]|nr:MFS transporter [Gemmatimonadales bacterium]
AFDIGAAHGLSLLYTALLLLAVGSALISPSAASYVSRKAPAEEQGRALGMLQSVGAVARIAGPVLAGAVAGHAGPRMAFFVASGAAGVAGLSAVIHPGESARGA